MTTQTELNLEMHNEGVNRYRKTVEAAQKQHTESGTGYGKRLLIHSLLPFIEATKAWYAEASKKKRGVSHSAVAPLSKTAIDKACVLAARAVLDRIVTGGTYVSVVTTIGLCVEDEVRWTWCAKNAKDDFKQLSKVVDKIGHKKHRRNVMVNLMNKRGLSVDGGSDDAGVFSPFTKAERVGVGVLLLDLFISSTGLVQIYECQESARSKGKYVEATQATIDWIRAYNGHSEVLDPMWLPSVVPPKPWTTVDDGGYVGMDWMELKLLKRGTKKQLKQAAQSIMPDVYTAINALQNTGWAINKRILEVAQAFRSANRGCGSLPQSEAHPLPEKPADIETNEEARKAWRTASAKVWKENVALRSNQIAAEKILNTATKFADAPAIYFPHQLDFRGRVYCVPTFLCPQGNDLAKALLCFSQGMPMNDDSDAYWLAVYGANLWGNDKIPFEDRVQWVRDNEADILASGEDPLGNQWWTEAGDTWQFLAFCMEWSSWRKQGPGFISHMPVNLDGTNNGLQVLSLLTRDEEAAKSTNVSPSAVPQDIYGDVARIAMGSVQADLSGESQESREIAEYWTSGVLKVTRKTAKRPVMVMPYGGTYHSCQEYVYDWFVEASREAKLAGDPSKDYKRTSYLARKIWSAIGQCVHLPREAMTWLQECAKIMSEANLPIVWTAPTGLRVVQEYCETKATEVQLKSASNQRITVTLRDDTKALDKDRQRNGVSPNYVHSCDAAALSRTVAMCVTAGIKSFAMIHDSYGTHAPAVHQMAAILRHAFRDLFSEDRLRMFRDELQQQLVDSGSSEVLPEPPQYGNLNINSVLDSEFFFA